MIIWETKIVTQERVSMTNSRYGGVKKNKLRAKVVYTVCAPMFPWLEPIQQVHYI